MKFRFSSSLQSFCPPFFTAPLFFWSGFSGDETKRRATTDTTKPTSIIGDNPDLKDNVSGRYKNITIAEEIDREIVPEGKVV